jgi:hypothetical protein
MCEGAVVVMFLDSPARRMVAVICVQVCRPAGQELSSDQEAIQCGADHGEATSKRRYKPRPGITEHTGSCSGVVG